MRATIRLRNISGNDSLEFGTFEPQTGGPFQQCVFLGKLRFGSGPFAFDRWYELCIWSSVGGWRRQLERNVNYEGWNPGLRWDLLSVRERPDDPFYHPQPPDRRQT
jgi:hypothetical protein